MPLLRHFSQEQGSESRAGPSILAYGARRTESQTPQISHLLISTLTQITGTWCDLKSLTKSAKKGAESGPSVTGSTPSAQLSKRLLSLPTRPDERSNSHSPLVPSRRASIASRYCCQMRLQTCWVPGLSDRTSWHQRRVISSICWMTPGTRSHKQRLHDSVVFGRHMSSDICFASNGNIGGAREMLLCNSVPAHHVLHVRCRVNTTQQPTMRTSGQEHERTCLTLPTSGRGGDDVLASDCQIGRRPI